MESKFNYLQGNANLNEKIVMDFFFVNFWLFWHSTDATYDICYSFVGENWDLNQFLGMTFDTVLWIRQLTNKIR